MYPERAVAWFGVGCYYACIGRHADARRHFGKATTLDPCFAPAWLGFGHAFAAQDESDQVPSSRMALGFAQHFPLAPLRITICAMAQRDPCRAKPSSGAQKDCISCLVAWCTCCDRMVQDVTCQK